MKELLGHISYIYTGATLRERPVATDAGNALLMQLGDLDTAGNLQTHGMIPVAMQTAFNKFTAQAGDVVFRPRGAGIVAAAIPETEKPIVITSPLMLIRPHAKKVDPYYLVWALRADAARRFYAEHSRGSAIVGIGKRDLEQMAIDLPPLDVQCKIAQLKRLESEEQQLLTRYQKAKSRLLEAMITDTIHKEQRV